MTTKDKSIYIKNVFYMLAYAFHALSLDQYEDLAGEEFEHMHDLFAAILAKGITRQVKQGLYREYLNRTEDLPTLRGKIELAGTIRNRIARTQRLSCEYDELSENNLYNQVLKTTSMLLLRHGQIVDERRSDLRKTMLFFSSVDEIEPASIRWDALRFQRNNVSYRFLLSVCQLVLEGMLITTERGERKLARFVDDQHMERLYEKFILEYYAAECDCAAASSPQVKWALDDGMGTLLPIMQTDVVLRRGNRELIIDAKYYAHTLQESYGVAKVHSENLYQIFTYVKNREAELADTDHEVSGMLLYAKTDEQMQPDGVYQMSGNQISVKTLDLNREFKEIAAQLDETARAHFAKEQAAAL